MKGIVLALALGASGMWLQAQTGGANVTFVGHDTVAKGGALVSTSNVIVQISRRTEMGMSEVHDKETDTFYILSGSATLVTGGEMIGSKPTAPGQYRGTGLTGGETHHLTKGDVMVVPARTPHWFKEVQTPIEYFLVKAVAP